MKKYKGFTILEMMIVLSIVALLFLLTLPNIKQKQSVIESKGCEALVEVINSQILLFEIDNDGTSPSMSDLVAQGYIKEKQTVCPSGDSIQIIEGEAHSGS